MTDDIVARLRLYAQKQRETRSSVLGLLLSDSADEIERLRKGGCARDQNTTQFCAEAVALQREVERLRAERDEARLQTRRILNEIDCRIEHGAQSGGHLEAIRNLFEEALDGK